MKALLVLALGLTLAAYTPSRAQTVVTLTADRDNTLYEDAGGALSNGAGIRIFTGRTDLAKLRRGLLHFDVAGAVPSGMTILEATLTLNMSRTQAGDVAVNLHRVLADWGEGASDVGGQEGDGTPAATGDATWIHTFYDTSLWTNPGGDFNAGPTATQTVGGAGFYAWTSTQLAQDVQDWLDIPRSNFGWILIGDESVNKTAKRFDSRENIEPANRPQLTITYDMALPVEWAGFTAETVEAGVQLRWETVTETGILGFDVQRRTDGVEPDWHTIDFVEGQGSTLTPHTYTFLDDRLPWGEPSVRYRLRQRDLDGRVRFTPEVEAVLPVRAVPTLFQNTPNPAVASTRIAYAVPRPATVRLTLHDILGRRIRSLVDAPRESGRHELTLDTATLPAGVFLVRLQVGEYVATRRMSIVR